MSSEAEAAKARAEARFTKQGTSGSPALGTNAAEAERAAVAAKTEKLRALRLAKAQSDEIAASVRKARRQR